MVGGRSKATVLALAGAILLAAAWQNSAASPLAVIDMASYSASGHIFGAWASDALGLSLAAGDFNGDHMEDILVGADYAGGEGLPRTQAGEAYIIFGSAADLGTVDLAISAADVTILGADPGDHMGTRLASGDFNDDGYADAVVASVFGDGPADDRTDAGEVYLIFGSATMGGAINTASGQQDVTIYGADAGDWLASSVAVGDVNRDGTDDLLLGTYRGDGPANAREGAGEAYVIFGSPTLSGTIDLAAGGADVIVYGEKVGALGDRLGYGLASGDFNADGTDDILVTAQWAGGPDNIRFSGDAYVVFGSPDLSGTVDIAASEQDFTIYGEDLPADMQDEIGSAAAGDLNGDGVDDILVVASRGDGPADTRPQAGEAYAVFGPVAQGGVVDAALSQQDLTIYGVDSADKLAQYVYFLTMGDVNGDGIEDIVVGSEAADGPGNSRDLSGDTYVIFGGPTLVGTIDLAADEESIVVYGAANGDKLASVAAGDLNGNGSDEILVAAPEADGVGDTRPACGEAFVISLPDTDGEGLLDIADPCPSDIDCDDDQYNDYVETYLETDALDACPDDPADDAWPPDINNDGQLSVVGDVLDFRSRIGATPGAPNWWQRLDLNADGQLSVVGDVLAYRGKIGLTCT